MKNILFILSLIIWCSCSNEILFDIDKVGDIVTRAANSDSTYCFGASDSDVVEDFVISPKDDSQPLSRTLCSYVEVNGTKTLLQPEIVSDPSWLDYLICFQYYDIYVLSVVAQDNTSSLRSGKIVLKQPGSNKTLTVGITQNGIDNRIMISMKELYSNHPIFTATTTYPVKKDISCRIPYEAYNDGGKYESSASITIPKGETKGTYEMDYNGSPLVFYHGDIKGYKLYEGTISGDGIYNYSFYLLLVVLLFLQQLLCNINIIMKKIIYLLAWIGVALASCSDESSLPIQPEIPAEPETPKDEPAPEKDYHQLPVLHVEGRYLKNEKGETVNLHGFTQTYSPFFNDNAWTNYDVQSCLSYNKRMVDGIVAAGWKFNFVRMHLDPYWSDDTSKPFVRYEGHERFSETRFRKYLDELFVPMAEYFVSKGMYVVMRPPGVCPNEAPYQGIEVGDSYQQFLLNVWNIVSQHPKVKNNTDIMFELANEPVNIKGTDGAYGSTSDACFANAKIYFQSIVDKIRSHCRNIIWVPGLAYQSQYAGYATHRIEGDNIGFAVHCYPGWYGSDAEKDSGEGIGSSTGGGYESSSADGISK